MKLLKYILLFCFIALFSYQTSQAQKLQTSEPARLSNEITHFDILGKVNGNILLYKYGRNYYEVNAFDSEDLELSWSKEIRFKHKRPNMLELILTNKGAFAFYNVKEKGQNILFVQPLDKQFRLNGEPLIVYETNERDAIYRITHSANRAFFAIEIIDRVNIQNQNIEVLILDKNLSKTGSISILNANNWKFRESLIGINGELFLVSDRQPTGFFANEALIQSIKINALHNGIVSELILKKEDSFYAEYKCELDLINSQLVLAGIYNTSENNSPEGSFFTKINYPANTNWDKTAITNEKFVVFPQELKAQTTRKSLLGQRNRLDEFKIRELIPRSDGGALVCGELFSKSTARNNPGAFQTDFFTGVPVQTESFNFDDMIVLSFAPNGDLEWTEVLRKSQYSEDDQGHFSSFGIMNTKKAIQLIFNEQIDYITPVSSFGVTNNGSSGINTLFNSEKYDILMSPRFAKQVAKNEVVIPAYTTRNYFVLVQLVY